MVTTGDIKPPPPTEAKKKCTKIYPCYIVLTDILPLIGKSLSASFRFIRSLKKTECSNMCKKMYFRRRLKAGKNVFNVKTPSLILKRLKDLEKVNESCITPKSTSEYTKLKYPERHSPVPESTLYPSMFMTKTGVKYAFDKVVEEKKSKFSEIRRRLIRREKDLIKKQIKKEKQELKAKQETESQKLVEEAEEEKKQFDHETERKHQLIILAEQIKIKREENFHRKAMRKKKQEMPYLKTGVSARSGRVIKPNPLFSDGDFALNGADIEGYRKLSALHRKQRKVLAAVRHMQNRAKRVNRVPVFGGLGAKLDSVFQSVIDYKPKSDNTTSKADLEIDNPDKEDGVRDFDLFDSKPKKKKLEKRDDGTPYEPVKKKSRKVNRIDEGDGVIIGTMPNTENLMKLFQGDNTVPIHDLNVNKGQPPDNSIDTGTQDISSAYPFARSLLNASKPVEQKQDKMSDLMKGAMVIDAKKEPVRFCVGGREVVVRKIGNKLVFLSSTGFEDKARPPKKKYTTKADTSNKIHKTPVTSSLSSVDTKLLATPSSSVALTYTKTNTMKGATPVLLTNAKGCPNSSVITLPFPLVSVPSTTPNYLKFPISQQLLQRAPIIVNPVKRSGLPDTNPVSSTKAQSLLSQTAISVSSKSETAELGIPSTSDTSSLTRTSDSTGYVTASLVASNIYFHPPKHAVFQTPTSSLVPVPGHVVFSAPSVYSSSYLPVTNTVDISQANSAGLSMANGVGMPLKSSVGLPLAKSVGLPLAMNVSLSQANTVGLSLANCVGVSSAHSVNFPLSNNVGLTEMSSKGNQCVTGEASSSASENLPKVLPVPVSQAHTTSTTAPSQTTAISGKGKFYLLKVDGKHILIPVPGSNTDAAMQTKAYLVNDLKVPVSSSISKCVTSPLTPLSTQTVHVSSPATVKPSQPFVPYGTNMPIMSYRVVTTSSDVRSITTASLTSNIVTSAAPSAPGSKVGTKETTAGRLVPTVLAPYTAPKVVTFSSASNFVSKSKDATIGAASADPIRETSAKVSTAAYDYIFPATKSLVSGISAPVSSVSNTGQYSFVRSTSVNAQASSRVTQEATHKVKFITPVGKETDENGRELTKPVQFETTIDKEERVENGPEISKPVEEEAKPKPFSEVVTDREERLRKLKELLKQKNEAVEQLRLGRNNGNTSIDGAEI